MDNIDANNLLKAFEDVYCLIMSVNISKNEFHIISSIDDFTKLCAIDISYDGLFSNMYNGVHVEYRQEFAGVFSRKRLVERYNNGERDITCEYRLMCCDGEYHWFVTRVKYVSCDPDNISVIILSELEDDEYEQKQQDIFYRNVIERISSSFVAILSIDINKDKCRPIKLTNVDSDFFGRKGSYKIDFKRYSERFIISEDNDKAMEFLKPDRLRECLLNYDDIISLDIREKINGEIKWARMQVQPSVFSDGKVAEVILAIKNIDEEKKKEEAIRQEIKKRQDQLLFLGKRFYRMHIYIDVQADTYKILMFDDDHSYDDILEGKYSENIDNICRCVQSPYKEKLLSEAPIEKLRERIAENSNEHVEYEYQRQLDDGSIKKYITSAYINSSDSGEEILISIRDVTAEEKQRKQLEDALLATKEANKTKSEFLSNMSHDMRTPMNVIVGMTSIAMVHSNDKDKVSKCLEQIDKSSQYLLQLINNVLDMSVIESGNTKLNESETNLVDIYEAVRCIIMPMIEEAGINIHQRSYNVEHTHVIADELKIRQILINIFSNAIKYTATGGTITVDFVESTRMSNDITEYGIVIADTGIGMSCDFVKKVGQPFERAGNSTLSKVHGIGLGMSITKTFIDLMGGEINIESEEGMGTTVSIILRLKYVPEENQTAEINELMDYSGIRVLVVDDNKVNRDIMMDYLDDVNIEYDMVNDGVDCIELLNKVSDWYYDIIFMDIQMPVMDGYEATLKIRQMQREYAKRVPIIALTANAFISDVKKSLDIGMNGHLAKPIMLIRLYAIIEKYYKLKSM